ncbi:DUF429 domain-containing protein [Streptomyces sp. HC44]|uniref:DUF429 domain-containing protein n=1 Tax=Streptomyces scabichelini TaxID=2711217 RepID=A0A6G4UX23_9ACTN|nr:DUF429 domain-containing protein [Streptomyces scabichelini]NGO06154.1 DUF429 domain-containing protein [Streptomyces scabichelini]
MRTVGIDLSASLDNTAVAVVVWHTDHAMIEAPLTRCTDPELLAVLTGLGPDDRAAVDSPFGWPIEFVRAVSAHAAGQPWPGRGQDSTMHRLSTLRFRRTDQVIWEAVKPGPPPLAAPFDRIGAMVARWAHLADELAGRGHAVDRAGTGRIAEVYPRATRLRWGLGKERSMGELQRLAPWLRCEPGVRALYDANEHAFDALICALTARAVAQGLTHRPTGEDLDVARVEGWIHLPVVGSMPRLLARPSSMPTASSARRPASEP